MKCTKLIGTYIVIFTMQMYMYQAMIVAGISNMTHGLKQTRHGWGIWG